MRGFSAFLGKEFLEAVRSYKLFIMLIVFAAFGMMNPLVAKLTPDLMAAFLPAGMTLDLPAPSALDSWTQFFKNISQIGLIIMVVVFSGVLSQEVGRGSLIPLLTKGLSRVSVIAAKLVAMVAIWTGSVAVCFGVTWGYTVYLFPGDQVDHLLAGVGCLWLFGVCLLAWLLLAASLTSSNYGCLLITGAVVVVAMVAGIIPEAYRYNPLTLASRNLDLLTGALDLSTVSDALVVTVVMTVACAGAAVLVFRRKLL